MVPVEMPAGRGKTRRSPPCSPGVQPPAFQRQRRGFVPEPSRQPGFGAMLSVPGQVRAAASRAAVRRNPGRGAAAAGAGRWEPPLPRGPGAGHLPGQLPCRNGERSVKKGGSSSLCITDTHFFSRSRRITDFLATLSPEKRVGLPPSSSCPPPPRNHSPL